MKCDKCGGLVIVDDINELKCLACSKRFYRQDVAMGNCHQPGCTSQTKGAYCYKHAGDCSAKDSFIRPEHAVGITGMEPEPKRRGRPPLSPELQAARAAKRNGKSIKESVAAWDRKFTPVANIEEVTPSTAVSVVEPVKPIVVQPPPAPPSLTYLEPVHVAFVVPIDTPESWIAFGETWKKWYPKFTICNFEPEDDGKSYGVMLEKS